LDALTGAFAIVSGKTLGCAAVWNRVPSIAFTIWFLVFGTLFSSWCNWELQSAASGRGSILSQMIHTGIGYIYIGFDWF
jgi:hypothetical protein